MFNILSTEKNQPLYDIKVENEFKHENEISKVAFQVIENPIAPIGGEFSLKQIEDLSPNMINLSLFNDLKAQYGNKYANLVILKSIFKGTKGVEIPLFFGFSDEQIKKHLSAKTRDLWEAAGKLDPKSPSYWHTLESQLLKVQENVRKDILASPLTYTPEEKQFLSRLAGEQLIVRSSSNEDEQEGCVNAGGNISIGGIPPTEEDLKNAVANVVASYFGLQSIKNRFEDKRVFQQLPLCSVLVMEQIMENGPMDSHIVSGVMMTHQRPGVHGQRKKLYRLHPLWVSVKGL